MRQEGEAARWRAVAEAERAQAEAERERERNCDEQARCEAEQVSQVLSEAARRTTDDEEGGKSEAAEVREKLETEMRRDAAPAAPEAEVPVPAWQQDLQERP
eukprot:4359544-Prymnesium_polylepis.1